jgi:hypothetical protein
VKKILGQVVVAVFGLLSLLGITPTEGKAIFKQETVISKISETTPLYLTHAKDVFSDGSDGLTWHQSHRSHVSHSSHWSHQSHYSHYSG